VTGRADRVDRVGYLAGDGRTLLVVVGLVVLARPPKSDRICRFAVACEPDLVDLRRRGRCRVAAVRDGSAVGPPDMLGRRRCDRVEPGNRSLVALVTGGLIVDQQTREQFFINAVVTEHFVLQAARGALVGEMVGRGSILSRHGVQLVDRVRVHRTVGGSTGSICGRCVTRALRPG